MSTSESVCWHIQADKYKEATGFPFPREWEVKQSFVCLDMPIKAE